MPETLDRSLFEARHTHVSYLRWIRGSVFREIHTHEVLLVDFPVGGAELSQDHKYALDQLAHAFNEANGRRRRSERAWEVFTKPYVINAKEGYDLVMGYWPEPLLDAVQEREPLTSLVGLPTDDEEVIERVRGGIHSFVAEYGLYIRTPSKPFAFGLLQGGASQTGPETNNITLSSLRGHAAAHYLIERHGIDPHFFDRVDAPGSSEPIIDAILEELTEAEVDVNRNARIVCTFAADFLLLLNRKDLKQRLDVHLHNLVSNGAAHKEHIQDAIGAYLMGIHTLRLAETMDFVGGEKPHPEWPDRKVPRSLITPMFQALSRGRPRRDTPTAPWTRYLAADKQRTKLEEAMARDADTAGGLLTPWERTLQLCGQRPELAHNLGIERISESVYRDLTPEKFIDFFDFFEATNDLQLKRHYDVVRPHFYWLSKEAKHPQQRAKHITGQDFDASWFLDGFGN